MREKEVITVELCGDCAECKYFADGECVVVKIAKTLCEHRND